MEILRIEVFPRVDGTNTIRVTGKNDAGQIIIGISAPTAVTDSPKALNDLVKKLGDTQSHVPHITPLGQP